MILELTFSEQLTLTLIDKAAIGVLVLIAGFLLNKLLEKYKSQRALANEKAKLRDAKRLEFIDKQLSQFYYPIYMRLQIDNATWERILDRRNGEDELRRTIGATLEEKFILPNHDEIVKIMQSNIHLAIPDPKLYNAMLQYIRHVAVYKAMREGKCFDKDPIHLGEPWPSNLFPLIKKTVEALQAQYNELVEANLVEINTAHVPDNTDIKTKLKLLANQYRNVNVSGFSQSVNELNEIANELGEYVTKNNFSKDELMEWAESGGNEGLFVALVSAIKTKPERDDTNRLLRVAGKIKKRHVKYRVVEAFGELFKTGIAAAADKDAVNRILSIYEVGEQDEPLKKQR